MFLLQILVLSGFFMWKSVKEFKFIQNTWNRVYSKLFLPNVRRMSELQLTEPFSFLTDLFHLDDLRKGYRPSSSSSVVHPARGRTSSAHAQWCSCTRPQSWNVWPGHGTGRNWRETENYDGESKRLPFIPKWASWDSSWELSIKWPSPSPLK